MISHPGYWLYGADGGVFSFAAAFAGSAADLHLASPTVGVAATRSGRGYWMATADGGIFTFGDARFFGSAAGQGLATPVIALIPTPTEAGYWLVTSGGDILAFGDAAHLISPGPPAGGAPVVAAAADPSGKGLWLADLNGHVRAVGDAAVIPSPTDGSLQSPRPLVGIAATPTGLGYWTAYLDGSVKAAGDAVGHGGLDGMILGAPIAGLVATADGGGYWLVGTDGGVFAFGTATFLGSAAPYRPASPVVALLRPGAASSGGAMLILGLLSAKTFSLTFDDGPNPAYTPQVLAVLAREHALATFFEVGIMAERYPDVARQVASAGDVIGNHSYSHADLTTVDPATFAFQVDRTQQVLGGLTGRAPRCLRPPYGGTNASVRSRLADRGLHQQMWTDDPSDFRLPDPDVLTARVLAGARPGGNVILHDGGGNRARTVAALPMIIEGLRAMGYTITPLCY